MEMAMKRALLMLGLALCSGCDAESSSREESEASVVPGGWQAITPLAGGSERPEVRAALPQNLRQTGESGIDSQFAAYLSDELSVRFSYGSAAHPGCPPAPAQCTIRDTEVAGQPARLSVAEAGAADRPYRSVHTYFVPGRPAAGNTSSEGAGLLVTVKCVAEPTCPEAERIASSIRM
jgi:hypothetical protein